MGRLKNGINGPVSGKVGDAVFAIDKRGNCTVRSKPRKRTRAMTAGEKKQTNKLSLISPLINPVSDFIRIGFELKADEMELDTSNAARSVNLKRGVKGKALNQEVDWENFLFSHGDLATPETVVINPVNNGFELHWSKYYDLFNGAMQDRTMIMLYSPELERHYYNFSGAQRKELQDFIRVVLPNKLRKTIFHIYLSFKEVTTNKVSDSVYCGAYTLSSGI